MRSTSMTPKFAMLLCALLLMPIADSADGEEGSDPAAIQVQTLTASLLKSMQAGRAESMTERYRNLEPVIKQVFGLPLMTRLSVGPEWTNFSPEQQNATIEAFSRFTIANYAHNFRDFSGQKFEIDGVVNRGQEKIVRTRIIPAHDTPVNLLYRMRELDGVWKVLDVDSHCNKRRTVAILSRNRLPAAYCFATPVLPLRGAVAKAIRKSEARPTGLFVVGSAHSCGDTRH
jgi:phospholipid transport system substrate-binding protein